MEMASVCTARMVRRQLDLDGWEGAFGVSCAAWGNCGGSERTCASTTPPDTNACGASMPHGRPCGAGVSWRSLWVHRASASAVPFAMNTANRPKSDCKSGGVEQGANEVCTRLSQE